MGDGLITGELILNGGIIALLTFTCSWGYKLWYLYLKSVQNEVNDRIEKEIEATATNYGSLKKEIGVNRFANRLLKLSQLKETVQDGKLSFEKKMIFSSVLIFLCGITYSALSSYDKNLLQQYQAILFIVLGATSLTFFYSFYTLYESKTDVEKYLNGKSVDDILDDYE